MTEKKDRKVGTKEKNTEKWVKNRQKNDDKV